LVFVGDVESDGKQVRMIAELFGDSLGVASGGNDSVAGGKSVLGHQRAETTRCTRNEPDFHGNSLSSECLFQQCVADEEEFDANLADV
jgi:hypothetical protein